MNWHRIKDLTRQYGDTSIAVGALLVAVAGIWLSIVEFHAAREHSRLSVMPAMTLSGGSWPDDSFVGIALTNEGLGPAWVEPLELFIDHERVESWDDVDSLLGLTDISPYLIHYDFRADVAWQVGLEEKLYGLQSKSPVFDQYRSRVADALDRVAVRVCFRSFYGEYGVAAFGDLELDCPSVEP